MSSYFIFSISHVPGGVIKNLNKIGQFDTFKEAKKQVKQLRSDQPEGNTETFKIIFAESELAAEEQLQEKREAPILKEWEK